MTNDQTAAARSVMLGFPALKVRVQRVTADAETITPYLVDDPDQTGVPVTVSANTSRAAIKSDLSASCAGVAA